MNNGFANIFLSLPAFALALFRITAMVLVAPVFSSGAFPIRMRAAFAMCIALIIFPAIVPQVPQELTFAAVVTGALNEAMIGLLIGLTFATLLVVADTAGTIAAQQAGLALGETINPLTDAPTSVMGQLYLTVLTLCFFVVGGHRALIAALLDSYKSIPVLKAEISSDLLLLLLEALSSAMQFGIRLAGPVLLTLFLTETALAFISRTVPQMNVLSIGFTVRSLIALGVISLSLMAARNSILSAFAAGFEIIRTGLDLPENQWSDTANAG